MYPKFTPYTNEVFKLESQKLTGNTIRVGMLWAGKWAQIFARLSLALRNQAFPRKPGVMACACNSRTSYGKRGGWIPETRFPDRLAYFGDLHVTEIDPVSDKMDSIWETTLEDRTIPEDDLHIMYRCECARVCGHAWAWEHPSPATSPMNSLSQLSQETDVQKDLLWENKAVTGNQMLGCIRTIFCSLTAPVAITNLPSLLWSQDSNPSSGHPLRM